jgi:hypothetical protein
VSSRFNYNSLSGDQLRIALAMLGVDESDVTGALDKALEAATQDVLAGFGLGGPGSSAVKGAQGVRPAKRPGTKSARIQRKGKRVKPAKAASINKRSPSPSSGSTDDSRALQGRYMVAIRRVPKSKRGAYKGVAKTKGREEAIARINNDYPASK